MKTSLKFIILNSRKQAVINYSGRRGYIAAAAAAAASDAAAASRWDDLSVHRAVVLTARQISQLRASSIRGYLITHTRPMAPDLKRAYLVAQARKLRANDPLPTPLYRHYPCTVVVARAARLAISGLRCRFLAR